MIPPILHAQICTLRGSYLWYDCSQRSWPRARPLSEHLMRSG